MSAPSLTATAIERDVVIAEGSDARSYLQTQLTQDVEKLSIGDSAWSFILDPKSSIEALVRVTRIGSERIVLDTDPGLGDTVRQRLDGLLFRTKVSFSQDRWQGVALRGEGARDVDAEAPIVSTTVWHDREGLDIIGPKVDLPSGVDVLDDEGLEDLRIAAGWPAMGKELSEGVTPAMTRIVADTVSFDKGCFTGQELVARVHHRGAEPVRSLVVVVSTGQNEITVGDALSVGDEGVGSVTSVASAGTTALGFVKRGTPVPGAAKVPSGPVEISYA